MPTADLTVIAQTWGCSPRTVARWKAEGAPLDDPARLRSWLANRKNLPAATKLKLETEGKARRARVADDSEQIDPVEIGAAAALRRLEQSEATAYRLLQSAIRQGDPIEIKGARENWLKIGDSLRRYDLLVEKGRRDAGELIPRGEIEGHVGNLVRCFKLACVRSANALAPNLASLQSAPEIADILRRDLLENLLNSFAAMAASPCKAKLPEWFLKAAVNPMGDTLAGADQATKARAEALELALSAMAEQTATQITNPESNPQP